MQLNPCAINKFKFIPEELVLGFIKTANPSVALTVAYASGKRKVKDTVLARIASFKIGQCPLSRIDAERQFQASISQFRKIDDKSYLVWENDKLTLSTSGMPKKSMFKPMMQAVRAILEHINEGKFDHLEIVYDCLEQKKTVNKYHEINKNIETLINRALQKYNKSLIAIFKENLHYRASDCIVVSKPLIISQGANPLIEVTFSHFNLLKLTYNSEYILIHFGKDFFQLPLLEKPRNIHYFAIRTLAELMYQNPDAKKSKLTIEYAWKPLAYAVGLVSGKEVAEENYQAAVKNGRKFARTYAGIKERATFNPNPSNPQVIEKRKAIMEKPMLREVDTDLFKYF